MTASDSEILTLLQDPATKDRGFLLLMQAYQQKLYGHIRRLVGTHEDAQDILQETFILVYNHLNAFKGESKLYTWLYRIATNECHRHFRHRRFRFQKMSLEESPAGELEAESRLDSGEVLMEKFLAVVRMLPPKQQTVFNLRYFDELSYEDMARILRTSEGTLRTTYHFAYERIKKYLSEHD